MNGNQLVCEKCSERIDIREVSHKAVLEWKRKHRHSRGRQPSLAKMARDGYWKDHFDLRQHVGRMEKADIQL